MSGHMYMWWRAEMVECNVCAQQQLLMLMHLSRGM